MLHTRDDGYVLIFDTTLREDAEQPHLVRMSKRHKRVLARRLARIFRDVSVIEGEFPIASAVQKV